MIDDGPVFLDVSPVAGILECTDEERVCWIIVPTISEEGSYVFLEDNDGLILLDVVLTQCLHLLGLVEKLSLFVGLKEPEL